MDAVILGLLMGWAGVVLLVMAAAACAFAGRVFWDWWIRR